MQKCVMMDFVLIHQQQNVNIFQLTIKFVEIQVLIFLAWLIMQMLI